LAQTLLVGSNPELVYTRSFDLGQTWQDGDTLSQVDGHPALEVEMAASQTESLTNVILTWNDGITCTAFFGCTIIERESRTNGRNWLDAETLTKIPRGGEPSVSIGPTGVAAITWTDGMSFSESHILVCIRPKGDNSWCPIVDLSPSQRTRGGSNVVISNNAIHVVWSELFPDSAGSFRIMYRRGRFIDTDVNEDPPPLPPYVSLEQNYPNPFNPNTRIVYKVGGRESVSLRVYDLLGREVATLVSEKKEIGEYVVDWNAEGLPSGVYYYRIITGQTMQTRKAVLIR
jgi:hypothetical protein